MTEEARPNGRILALDYGLKRVGVAITDPLGYSAQPLPVLYNEGDEGLIEALVEIAKDQRVALILLGLPLNMDGTDSPMSLKVQAFKEALEARLPERVGVEVKDERLTSWSAEKEEFAKGKLPWKDKEKIDTRAAMILLEDYLNHLNPQRNLLTEDAPVPEDNAPWQKSKRSQRGRGRRGRRDRRR